MKWKKYSPNKWSYLSILLSFSHFENDKENSWKRLARNDLNGLYGTKRFENEMKSFRNGTERFENETVLRCSSRRQGLYLCL